MMQDLTSAACVRFLVENAGPLTAVQCKRRVGQLPIYSYFSSHVFKSLCLATFEGVHGRFDVTLFWVYLVHFFEMFK